MKTLKRVLSWTPMAFAMMLLMPSAYAGPLGDAFEQTVRSSGFSYDAQASVNFDKGGESDLPFDMSLNVTEKGGKSGDSYGKKGHLKVEVTDIEDLPRVMSDMSYVNMTMEYSGAQVGSTSYGEIPAAFFETDGKVMGDITGMMNQMAKFFTGKAFRVSQSELATRLRQLMGPSSFASSDEELFISFLTGGSQSVEDMIGAVGVFLDDLVASGFLNMEVTNQRRSGRRSSAGVAYVLTLGNEVSVEGAAIFRDGLADFIATLLPGIGEMAAQEIGRESAETIARDLNAFFDEVRGVRLIMEVGVEGGSVSDLYFSLDLSSADVPLRVEESVVFNYSTPYQVDVPRDERNIIDMNQIVDGFVAIGEMAAAPFQDYGYNDFDFEDSDFSFEEVYVVPFDSLVYGDVEYIRSVCGGERSCTRREMREVQRNLRSMLNDGFISNAEYRRAIRDLRKAL